MTAFLTHLAVERDVAAATQQQALSALLFLYKQVLEIELPWLNDIVRAKKPARLPTVLNEREVETVLSLMSGVHGLMTMIYMHVLNRGGRGGRGVASPLDRLSAG